MRRAPFQGLGDAAIPVPHARSGTGTGTGTVYWIRTFTVFEMPASSIVMP